MFPPLLQNSIIVPGPVDSGWVVVPPVGQGQGEWVTINPAPAVWTPVAKVTL